MATAMPFRSEALDASRVYSIRELARRAGVSDEFFRSWELRTEDSWTIVRVGQGAVKKLRFPVAVVDTRDGVPLLENRIARAKWAYEPESRLRDSVPEFIVPFVAQEARETPPIFRVFDDRIDFCYDILSAALWTLGRVEEILSPERDSHGRFPASASIAVRHDFLLRPVVDEYGLALEQALRCLIPAWQPEPRKFRVKLSHDIDLVGLPFSLRTTAAHVLTRRDLSAAFVDLVSTFTDRNTAYLAAVEKLARMSSDRHIDSAFYWMACAPCMDGGYDLQNPKIRRVISGLLASGTECGIHPGYDTFGRPDRLQAEIDALSPLFGHPPSGGRQHFLRWRPETWLHWEACGLRYDSTVGFADRLGFRAGTSIPYRPWIFNQNREANLLEIPLIVMDGTLWHYMGLSTDESLVLVKGCIERVRQVGGVFTLLWHNTSLFQPGFRDLYPLLLEMFSGAGTFDWAAA